MTWPEKILWSVVATIISLSIGYAIVWLQEISKDINK